MHSTVDKAALTDLIMQVAERLELPIERTPAPRSDRPIAVCAGQLVTLLRNMRGDLGWAIEYADDLAVQAIMAAPPFLPRC